jgi:hypothetical protein
MYSSWQGFSLNPYYCVSRFFPVSSCRERKSMFRKWYLFLSIDGNAWSLFVVWDWYKVRLLTFEKPRRWRNSRNQVAQCNNILWRKLFRIVFQFCVLFDKFKHFWCLNYLSSVFQKILSFKIVWTFRWMAVGWTDGRIDNCELHFWLHVIVSICALTSYSFIGYYLRAVW